MTGRLPAPLAANPLANRLEACLVAVHAAGAALLQTRGSAIAACEVGDQLKTAADLAAEGWVLGYLRGLFPGDAVLSEERYEVSAAAGEEWAPRRCYWVLDALDGTRSYAGGFDTFCVQLAWIADGQPAVAVVHEPVAQRTYLAIHGAGAYRLNATRCDRISVASHEEWPAAPRFVDSTRPDGIVGEVMGAHDARFVECGSIGLKICRVAEGSADVFAKALRFKLWDVAPGELILAEAGGRLGDWDGAQVAYGGDRIFFRDILAAPDGLFPNLAREIAARR